MSTPTQAASLIERIRADSASMSAAEQRVARAQQ
jgi:hypothetical protein